MRTDPGVAMLARQTGEDANGNEIGDACEQTLELSAQALGCRALSLTPGLSATAAGTPEIAVKLTSPDFPCLLKYVDNEGQLLDSPSFTSLDLWSTVNVADALIVPDATYELTVESSSGLASNMVPVQTWVWGDANNNGIANVADMQLIVQAFQMNFTNVSIWTADIAPCDPNGIVNFEDVQQACRPCTTSNMHDDSQKIASPPKGGDY